MLTRVDLFMLSFVLASMGAVAQFFEGLFDGSQPQWAYLYLYAAMVLFYGGAVIFFLLPIFYSLPQRWIEKAESVFKRKDSSQKVAVKVTSLPKTKAQGK